MHELMPLEIILTSERFIAQVTAKWPLSGMYALMYLQLTLPIE
jgi:hypothetical protein